MPTARFEADFSGFIAAINASQIALIDFNKGAETVQTTLNKMTDQFSGREIIQEASLMVIAVEKLGGVASLTADELQTVGAKAQEAADKLRAMGSDVPAAIQKYADAAKDASGATDSWGVAVSVLEGAIGAFSIAGAITSIIAWVKSVGDASVEVAHLSERLQTSYSDVQQFQLIAAATDVPINTLVSSLQTMQDKLGKGDTGLTKAFADLHLSMDTLKDQSLLQQFASISTALDGVTDANQRAVDAQEIFGTGWKKILPATKADIADVTAGLSTMSDSTVQYFDDSSKKWHLAWESIKADLANALHDQLTFTAAVDATNDAAADLARTMKTIPDITDKISPAKLEPIKTSMDDLIKTGDAMTATQEKQIKAWGDWQTAVDNIQAKMTDFHATLATMDPALVAIATHELELGAQARDVATAHYLTKIQIDAVVASMKELDDQSKEDAKSEQDYANQVLQGTDKLKAAQAAYNDYLAKTTEDTTTYQINKLWEKVDQEEKSFEGSEAQRAEYNKVVEALADAQTDAIVAAAYKAEDGTKEALDQTVTDYKEASEKIQQYKLTPASQGASQAMTDALAEVDASNIGQMMKMGTTSVAIMNQYQAAIEAAMAQRGYSVGGGLTPAAQNAGYGAGGINTTVNVNGSVLSTPAQLSTAVSAALADAMRRAGISLPSQ
jgi:hypothetical protein